MSDRVDIDKVIGGKFICEFCNPPKLIDFSDGPKYICPDCKTEYWIEISIFKYPNDDIMDEWFKRKNKNDI